MLFLIVHCACLMHVQAKFKKLFKKNLGTLNNVDQLQRYSSTKSEGSYELKNSVELATHC